MPRRLADTTLEQFRRAVAAPHPTPAGVAVAAVSAGFALGVLAKALTVSARRKELAQHTGGLQSQAGAAAAASERMLQLAAEDGAAFDSYLTARRLPRVTEAEQEERLRSIASAVHQAIHVPLAAAREAAAGLQLCSEAAELMPPALIADLGVAAALLGSALRAFLLCAESNVQQLAADAALYREGLAAEKSRHEPAFRQAQAVLERAATAIG